MSQFLQFFILWMIFTLTCCLGCKKARETSSKEKCGGMPCNDAPTAIKKPVPDNKIANTTKIVNTTKEANGEKRNEKLCMGMSAGMPIPNDTERHYHSLRDRYTNCTNVIGNLELTWIQDDNLDLAFLKDIREVSGYVFISHVDVSKVVLPSLQIVRGRSLFKLQNAEYALIVTLSKIQTLEMPALREILSGGVAIRNNRNLCHIKTIKWKDEILSPTGNYTFEYNLGEAERNCTPCDESCTDGCWGEGPHNCQMFSKINCSPQCNQARCFGTKPTECCHPSCVGGCTGSKESDCLACRTFYDDGVCRQECPPMQKYNPDEFRWENNPDGKYAYGNNCVKDCPKPFLKDNGGCVKQCSPEKLNENGECVPCDGPCPET